jgi:hypothetical protein
MHSVGSRLLIAGAVLVAATTGAVAGDRGYDERRDDRRGGPVVDAPGAYVDTRGPVIVDAPAARVGVNRDSVHVEAPFVNLRIPR